MPVLDILLSSDRIDASDADAGIIWEVHLSEAPGVEGLVLPVRHASGITFDLIWLPLHDGAALVEYTPRAGLPLGVWTLEAADLPPVLLGGRAEKITLTRPVSFTVFRQLTDYA